MIGRRRRWLRWAAGLGALVLVAAVGRSLLPLAPEWLNIGGRPARADYALVLGGGADSRPLMGGVLYRQGLVSTLLVSHVSPPPAVQDGILPAESAVMRRVLLARGVPAERIEVIGRDHRTTYDEARTLHEFLATRPGATVIVITSDYHSRRARWIFRQVFGSEAGRLSFVGTPSDDLAPATWWTSERGFTLIMGEYVKLLLYQFRYSLTPYAVLAGVALAVAAWKLLRRQRQAL